MTRLALLIAVAAAVVFGCASSQAPQGPPPPAPDPQAVPGPHTIHVTVSGPDDTVMRVARAGTQTQVELRGEPFEYEFTEERDRLGELGIAVYARSASPGQVHCGITVNGEVVAEQSAREPGADGFATVGCTIPISA
ncbi:hypothetical protein [Amycolatopsis cihanbeyliensis]|uniref:MmpS family membrane protein n=1 Tax=Amycolatopsis cihanbeyliensis TaxID=1128664 RepID=A0A542DR84_AMYCI|nr:hypothetical protein [Amycolatopsis cihanbeyliensis]TQJ05597.1 hypothetical protein FB471_5434 [Amycolatopsis cihanbeyliensis]